MRAGFQRVGRQGSGIAIVVRRIGDDVAEALLDKAQRAQLRRRGADHAGDDAHAVREIVAGDVLSRERRKQRLLFQQDHFGEWRPARKAQPCRADAGADIEHAQRAALIDRNRGGQHDGVEAGAIAVARLQNGECAAKKGVVGNVVAKAGCRRGAHGFTIH